MFQNKIVDKKNKEPRQEIRLSQSLNNLESKQKEPKQKVRGTPRNPRKGLLVMN